ncbi:MAG TPA: hypothetical protein VI356_17005 [Myxococcales bacterium]
MGSRLHSRVVVALLAPALVLSGAAQGVLLPCAPDIRTSCCCPGKQAPPPSPMVAPATPQCCAVSAPAAPPQARHDPSAISAPLPMLVAVAREVSPAHALFAVLPDAPRLDPPPGLSPVLANCALLI